MKMSPELKRKIIDNQRAEITEYTVYDKLSHVINNPKDKELLKELSELPNFKKSSNSDENNFFKRFSF